MLRTPALLTLTTLFAAPALADSFKDDFSSYSDQMDFSDSYYVFIHPSDAQGTAVIDTTADAAIITAGENGKAFQLAMIINQDHSHRLGVDANVRITAEFDDAASVPPWAPEPIAPQRIGLSGAQAGDIYGQVALVKKGDPKGTLHAKVVVKEGGEGDEVVIAENTITGYGSYDGKEVTLAITGDSLDLLVDGESVIDGPVDPEVDWASSPLADGEFRAYVQQQRVFAPQPRSVILHRLEVEDSDNEPM